MKVFSKMANTSVKRLIIGGIRGLPARHGGFETFAEYLSLYLVKNGWEVIVYCQGEKGTKKTTTTWQGITLITIPEVNKGPLGTVLFDLSSIIDSLKYRSLVLTLGYNTACFNLIYRIFKIPNVINMDGIEWKRDKWGLIAKSWFWLNEKLGSWIGNHLIADHPEIAQHLLRNVSEAKISTIPYGAEKIEEANIDVVSPYALLPKKYALIIARQEPENSILEMVRGFSKVKRNFKLVVIGCLEPEENEYHKAILKCASEEVLFLGAIYDKEKLSALRFYTLFYLHGHKVGGTNPSLVEALGAHNPVLAHDNKFNRWVAEDGAEYFKTEDDVSNKIDKLITSQSLINNLEEGSRISFEERYKWDDVLKSYEDLLTQYVLNSDQT